MSGQSSNDDFLEEMVLHQKYAPLSLTPYLRERSRQFGRDEKLEHLLPDWRMPRPQNIDDKFSLDRAIGCFVGLAIGDALGTTLEFQPRDKFHVTRMQGGGVFGLAPGEWTDDTSMALCLAESYLKESAYSTTAFMDNMIQWYRNGHNSHNGRCFDIGNTTRFAVESYEREGLGWRGNNEPHSAGNAPIIRLAPACIFQRKSFHETYRDAEMQAEATHRAQEAGSTTQLLARQLHCALNGASKEEVLGPHILPLSPKPMKINAGLYKDKARDQIKSSGYIIDTLEAAAWSVWKTDNFEEALLLAVNLADDSDSVGATAGQLAGALYGYSGIPKAWLAKLAWHDKIVEMAKDLFNAAPADGDWIYINPKKAMKELGMDV